MTITHPEIKSIIEQSELCPLSVQTLGSFSIKVSGESISHKNWSRDVALQLFQFLITNRKRQGLHKEQITDRIWYNLDSKAALQNFKVAHHNVNKILEPQRPKGADPQYVIRNGPIYHLDMKIISVDIDLMESLIALANDNYHTDAHLAKQAYGAALELDKGPYMPNRLYEDWSSEERERIQLLIMNAYISLSELYLNEVPAESIRLTQKALSIDNTWEDAYRIQMQAYHSNGNRPMVLKTYKICKNILEREYGIEPLPETRKVMEMSRAV